jgi:hypothetical protein
MHLAELFALTAGVKIGTPTIETSYFPVGCEKYITIQAGSGMESKNYDYFNDVVKTISPQLDKEGVRVIQVGLKDEKLISGAFDLRGKTTIRQCAFVIKNALVHVGNDSFGCHVASGFNTPMVGLYGVSFPQCVGPFWGDKAKQLVLAPDFSKTKPSFSKRERDKRVNSIFPDEITRGILRLLGLDKEGAETAPVHLGASFHRTIVDVVPDFEPGSDFAVKRSSPINIRLDYLGNKEPAKGWLEEFKCVVHTNNRGDIPNIKKGADNIKKLYVYLSDEHTAEDIDKLSRLAIPMHLHYPHKDKIGDVRVKFFGSNIKLDEEGSKKDLDFSDKICDTSVYKSSLNLYSNNKVYPCKAALDLGIEKKEEQFAINNSTFYKEIEFFKIYNYGKKKDAN